MSSRFTPCLWFNGNAEEAGNFYVSVFKNSRILNVTHTSEEVAKVSGQPAGQVLTVEVSLDGQDYLLLNGGPQFRFSEAISFMINCDTQEEIDYYWEKLTADGGQEVECGWLRDRFGLSWQVVPSFIAEVAKDASKYEKLMTELLTMKKLDLERLRRAAES